MTSFAVEHGSLWLMPPAAIGYPQTPRQLGSFSPGGPDEALLIGGFSLDTAHNWLMRLSLMLPTGDWDQYADRIDGSGQSNKRWPLFHLLDPTSGAYVEFVADCEQKQFLVKVKFQDTTVQTFSFGQVGNTGKQAWLPDSPLHVAIGFNITDSQHKKLYIAASLGGDVARVLATGIEPGWASSVQLSELWYRGAAGEVCSLRVFGGEIDNDATTPPTPTTLATAFSTLDFLL